MAFPKRTRPRPKKKAKEETVRASDHDAVVNGFNTEIDRLRSALSRYYDDVLNEQSINRRLTMQLAEAHVEIGKLAETAGRRKDRITVLENALHALQVANVISDLPDAAAPAAPPEGPGAFNAFLRTFHKDL